VGVDFYRFTSLILGLILLSALNLLTSKKCQKLSNNFTQQQTSNTAELFYKKIITTAVRKQNLNVFDIFGTALELPSTVKLGYNEHLEFAGLV
jgi:hypothetical protein